MFERIKQRARHTDESPRRAFMSEDVSEFGEHRRIGCRERYDTVTRDRYDGFLVGSFDAGYPITVERRFVVTVAAQSFG